MMWGSVVIGGYDMVDSYVMYGIKCPLGTSCGEMGGQEDEEGDLRKGL
jgi:hypothetical protein